MCCIIILEDTVGKGKACERAQRISKQLIRGQTKETRLYPRLTPPRRKLPSKKAWRPSLHLLVGEKILAGLLLVLRLQFLLAAQRLETPSSDESNRILFSKGRKKRYTVFSIAS